MHNGMTPPGTKPGGAFQAPIRLRGRQPVRGQEPGQVQGPRERPPARPAEAAGAPRPGAGAAARR
ncbi:hypothetical protein, partial [Sphingomonas sp.]|uniref:hypothetical protein n=1 Tax=Sphingomonas sp. TaxID=28214 RepID=UPI00286F7609